MHAHTHSHTPTNYTCTHTHKQKPLCMKAAERGHYEVAQLLTATSQESIHMKDNRGRMAIDLLKATDEKWRSLLQDNA